MFDISDHIHHSKVLIVKPESVEKFIFSIFLAKENTIDSQDLTVTICLFQLVEIVIFDINAIVRLIANSQLIAIELSNTFFMLTFELILYIGIEN